MKLKLIALLVFIGWAGLVAGQTITDPAHIEVYVTPYYNSKGPTIDVGPFSSGLAAKNEPEFIATIPENEKIMGHTQFSRDVRRRDSPLRSGFQKRIDLLVRFPLLAHLHREIAFL
jgi:hypothetical protein